MTSQWNAGRKFRLQPLSLVRMFWKHKLLCVLVWAAITVSSAAVVYRLSNVYRAEAVILVESQRIPEKLVAPTINDDLKDRLSSLSQQILISTRLLEIVTKFDLYHEQRGSRTQEEIIEMMRGDIGTQLETSWAKKADSRPSAFRVTYEGPNPTVVAQVANQLATLFIDENIQAREVQAAGTSEFLASQLDAAKLRLEEQENKLGGYKLKFNGQLPQQENALIAAASQLQVRLQGITQEIDRAEQTRTMQETALASAQASEAAISQLFEQLNSPAPAQAIASASGEPAQTSERLQQQLEKLLLVYTDQHPDVKKLRDLIPLVRKEEEKDQNALKKSAPGSGPADSATKAPGEESSASMIVTLPKIRNERALQLSEALIRSKEEAEKLKTQQGLAVKEIASLKDEQKSVQARLDSLQGGIGRLPIREQELASINRDYEISKANYQSLLDKKLSAEMATDMERRQKAERFTIIDPARVPEKPVRPNRPLLYALCSFCGLLLGIASAMGRELKSNAILGEWELPKGVPVLGRIPRIVPAVAPPSPDGLSPNVTRKRVRLALIWSSALVVAIGAIGAAAAFYFGKFGH
jgi:polysaccharide chain length determinant protein (PEP-CTERM system associated)